MATYDSETRTVDAARRAPLLRRGLALEGLTVGWNMVEALVAIAAALAAGSVALMAFGVDSVVETASGAVMIWRLFAERRNADHEVVERVEQRARKLVALSLGLLAAYVTYDAATSLVAAEAPSTSTAGIVLLTASILVMWWLARAKRRVARDLHSHAMEADAFQTTACFWLSVFGLAGLGLNAALGWWWADPAAALVMVLFIVREARDSWKGEECCESPVAAPDSGS